MNLHIDTSSRDDLILSVTEGKRVLETMKIAAAHAQAEKLLPSLEKILRKMKKNLSDIKKISVEDGGESFTALRIGVATANALGYALNIPVASSKGKSLRKQGLEVVQPRYAKPPTIRLKQ